MIVRIMGQGQYSVDPKLMERLNVIDNRIVDHVSRGDEKEFRRDLALLISSIKESGKPLDKATIVPSEVIVPPQDLTLKEAKSIFSGQGLIEDK
jgi:hypothetical protein